MSNSMTQEIINASPNRRKFLKVLGVASAAVGAMGVGATEAMGQSSSRTATATEVAVLNFALNLEYLEAEFYSYALHGMGIEGFDIPISGMSNGSNPSGGGMTTGGQKITFSDDSIFSMEIGEEIGEDERAHVGLLRYYLGDAAIARPNINLNALMAKGVTPNTETGFLTLARIFEDIGVSAYAGAAYLLTTPFVIQTAARILATEAEHTASLRTQIAKLGIATPKLDGADLVPPPTGPQDTYLSMRTVDGLPALRSVPQVLNLAYGGAGLTMGGFFPSGINGAFADTASSAPAPASNLSRAPMGFAPRLK